MNPAYAIARLAPELTTAEVAAYLSGLTRFERVALLCKYADWRSEKHLIEMLLSRVAQVAAINNWRHKKGQLLNLCEMVVLEWLKPLPCRACDLTGEVATTREERDEGAKDTKACPICGGRGMKRYSGARKAEGLGVDRSTWGRIWARRYDKAVYVLERAESKALEKVRKNMREGA
jgi:hypothetical protein